MHELKAKDYPDFFRLQGFAEATLRQHYKLYLGYVKRYNELFEQYMQAQKAVGHLQSGDLNSVKVDLTYALSAIKNHELFFDILGGDRSDLPEDSFLGKTIARDYGGMAQFIGDLRTTAAMGRGWCWSAYDLDRQFLFTYNGGTSQAMPVWNAIPILAIDLYGHAYLYDFGANKAAYIDNVIRNLNWKRVADRFADACNHCNEAVSV